MSLFTSIYNNFLKFFGDIKVFKYPFFILYDPGSYRVKGAEVRKVLESIEKGDILIRGYVNYLDGLFIPGFFSHAGLFLGDTKNILQDLPEVLESKVYRGSQAVIHSMAEGVFMEDLINFCKCDYLIILRRNKNIEPENEFEPSHQDVCNDAIRNVGKPYDFKFNFSSFGNLSCTELVFNAGKDFFPKYKVSLKPRLIMLKSRQVLIPDDFVTDKFTIVFRSKSIPEHKLQKILEKNKN